MRDVNTRVWKSRLACLEVKFGFKFCRAVYELQVYSVHCIRHNNGVIKHPRIRFKNKMFKDKIEPNDKMFKDKIESGIAVLINNLSEQTQIINKSKQDICELSDENLNFEVTVG